MANPTVTLLLRGDASGLKTGVGTARRELGSLGESGQRAGQQARAGLDQVRASTQSVAQTAAGAARAALGLASALVSIQGARQLSSIADEASNIRAQLDLATRGQEAYARAQAEVFAISQRTSTALASTAELYARITRSTAEYGIEQARVLRITESINQSFVVSGTAATAQANAITQLTQAFAGGVLRAEEFNSVIENSPRLAQALADGLGVGIGALRQQVNDGEVTVQRMIAALESQAATIEAEFARMPLTIDRAWTQLGNAVLKYLGDADQAIGASQSVAGAMAGLARNLGEVIEAALTVGAVIATAFAGRAVGSLAAYTAAKVKALAATSAMAEMERRAAAAAVTSAEASALAARQTEAQLRSQYELVRASVATAEAMHNTASANLVAAQRHADAARAAGVQSFALRELAIAEASLAAAQRTRSQAYGALSALDASAARMQREVAAAQSASAAQADLLTAANARLAASKTGVQVAMAAMQRAGSALFALVGGWPTVVLAAAYALYQLYDVLENGSKKTQAIAADLQSITAQMVEGTRQADLMARGVSTALAGQTDKLAQAAVASREATEAQRALNASWVDAVPIMALIRTYQREIAEADYRNAQTQVEAYLDALAAKIVRSTDAGTELREALASVAAAGIPIESLIDRVDDLGGSLTLSMQLWKPFATAGAVAVSELSKSAKEAVAALKEKRETLNLSAAELVLYQAKQEAAKEATQEGRDAIMAEAQALADSITAKDAAKAASEAITETRRKEAEQLRDLTRSMREAEQERDRELAMAEEAAGSASDMIDALRDEAKQVVMTEAERRRLAETRAFDAAMQAAQAARTPEQLAALRAEFEAAMKVRDASELVAEQQELTSEAAKRAAEDSARAWSDFAQGLGRAVLDGAGGVKRYFKQLLDDLKAQIISSGLMNLFRSIFNLGSSNSGSPLSMLGAMFSGGGAGGGGISFGSIMSAFGGQSGGTGGGILSNLFSAQSWARAGQQLAGGFTSMFGGAGNVSALQSYGVLNTPTGMAGGFAGHGGLAGWGGAAAGALYGLGRGDGGIGTVGSTVAGGVAGYYAGGVMAGAAAGGMAGAGAAMAAIPVAGWIAAAALAIDALTGGKLFGTRYRPESSTSTLSIGDDGGDASMSIREVRQRSLFRGRRWRTRDVEAGDDAEEAADQLYESIYSVMAESARALAIDTPPMIDAAIRTVTEYDKKGKAKGTKIFVDILGRTWEEATAELAASRLSSEAIIATIDAALGTTVEAALAGIDEGIDRASPEFRERIGEMIDSLIPKDEPSSAGTVGEASAIAERWRSDAELLAEGAQFLLMAATDIRRGTGLLGEGGTLTQITDLIEDLQGPGESLAQTYARVAASTALLDQALALSGVSIEGTREHIVRLATDIAEAAGGLDRAASLWSNYFDRFYSDSERARAAVTAARANATTQFADIDLDYTQFTGEGGAQAFRELFESVFPTLSAAAIAQWLEAAEALGIVIDATDAYVASMTAQARAQASIIGEINAGIADLSMTDYERQVAGIEGQTRSYVEALVEAGMTMEQATTHALRWRDAQLGALEAQRQAARTSITEEMADSVADVGRSDWERQMVALDRRAQDYITALVETGVALDAATSAANAWRDSMRAALEEQRRGNFIDQLDDIEWEQSLAGMSAYDRQVATINRRYDELYATAVELGLGEDELLRIRRLQRGELDALASSTENASRALAQLGLAMVDAGGAVLGTEDARRSWTDIIAEATGVARGDSLSAEQRAIAQVNERFQRFASSITEGYQQGRLGAIIAGNVEQFDREYLDRISQLEALRIEALANLRNDLDRQRFEREEAWVKRLLGLRDSLLLDEQLSTLTPAERVSEAQRQYDAAVSAIQAAAQTAATDDDEAARGAFESVARTLLREGRTSFGSDYRYDALLAQVLGDIDRFIADSPITVGQRVAEQAMQVVIPEGSLKLDTQPVEVLLNGLRNDQDEQTRAMIEEMRAMLRLQEQQLAAMRQIVDNTRGELMPVRAV